MTIKLTRTALLTAAALAGSALAAQASPTGVWLDHTGRAAIEITDCSGKLCGKMVWFKDASNNSKGCNVQIIGDVKPVAGGKWDNGWILDPEKDSKYDVEITPLSGDRLKVMGYAGMKFLSETYTWTRAPADIKRCDARSAERTPPPADEPPFTPPPAGPSATPQGPGPSTGPGPVPPEARPAPRDPAPEAKPEKRRSAAKQQECKFELGGFKLTLPCDDD